MKRKGIGLVLLATILVLAGCGKKQPEPETVENINETTSENDSESTDTNNSLPEAAEDASVVTEEIKVVAGMSLLDYEKDQEYKLEKIDESSKKPVYISSVDSIRITTEGYDTLNASMAEEFELQKKMLDYNHGNDIADMDTVQMLEEYGERLPFGRDVTSGVLRHDTVLFSTIYNQYAFNGGAHPDMLCTTANYSSTTGKKLKLNEIADDYDKLYKNVLSRLKKHEYSDGFYDDYEDSIAAVFYGDGEPNWYLDGQGFQVLFDRGEIGAYALGALQVTIPYSECRDVIREKYILKAEQMEQLYGVVPVAAEKSDNLTLPEVGYVPVQEDVYMPGHESVTYANLQGTWENAYSEQGHDYVERLIVNGKYGKLESYCDGIPTYAWNTAGTLEIEDRSDRGKSPKVSVIDEENGGGTIYIRSVDPIDGFYDAGFNCVWKKIPNDENFYRIATVNMDNLKGTWVGYSYLEGELHQDIFRVKGDRAIYMDVIDGVYDYSSVITGNACIIIPDDEASMRALLIQSEDGDDNFTVYISEVSSDSFYDPVMNRWFARVK